MSSKYFELSIVGAVHRVLERLHFFLIHIEERCKMYKKQIINNLSPIQFVIFIRILYLSSMLMISAMAFNAHGNLSLNILQN